MSYIWETLVPLGESPQQIGINITSYVTLAVAVITLIGTFVSKKTRTPADELAKADFAYTKIRERLTEVDADRSYLSSVVDALRSQLQKADDDASLDMEEKRKLRALVTAGDFRIQELTRQNGELHDRLTAIAEKVRMGQHITLVDVYGNVSTITPAMGNDLGDLELTVVPKKEA